MQSFVLPALTSQACHTMRVAQVSLLIQSVGPHCGHLEWVCMLPGITSLLNPLGDNGEISKRPNVPLDQLCEI